MKAGAGRAPRIRAALIVAALAAAVLGGCGSESDDEGTVTSQETASERTAEKPGKEKKKATGKSGQGEGQPPAPVRIGKATVHADQFEGKAGGTEKGETQK